MKKLIITIIFLLAMVATAYASGCFLSYEYISGMNKICVYDCIDGQRAITISSLSFCPLSL